MTTPQDPRSGQPVQPSAGMYQAPTPGPGGDMAMSSAPKISFLKAITPEPTKAPPLEWVALVVGLVLAISAFLPWVTIDNGSFNGLDTTYTSGNGWMILAAGLGSVVLGFFGLSRDSISLAVGQALLAILTLIFAVIDLNPGSGASAGFGVILALIASVLLIALSAYNAFDAQRKGATY